MKMDISPGSFGLFRRLWRSGAAAAAAIEEELTCQVQFLLDRGHQPTHLNGHQYIEMLPVVGPTVESLLKKFHIPVVRVAWERSWRESFSLAGHQHDPMADRGIEKVLCRPFPPPNARQQVLLCRRVLGR